MDASEFKDVFAAEAHEYIQALNQDLLRLESNPNDRAALNDMFRAAHSLKGMSGTMGYQELADFTHQIESLLDLLRIGELTATESVVNTMFSAIDSLQNLLEKTLLEEELPDLEEVTAELRHLIQQRNNLESNLHQQDSKEQSTMEAQIDIELEDFDLEVVRAAKKEGYLPYKVVVRLLPKTLMKSVRAYTVFQALENIGTIIKSNPPAQELEDEKFDQEFALVLLTKRDADTVKNTVERISEIEHVAVLSIQTESAESERRSVLPRTGEQVVNETAATAQDLPVKQKQSSSVTSFSRGAFVDRYIRVETERLDGLINLIGELVISKTQVMEIEADQLTDNTKNALVQLERITTELQYAAMKLRMVPIKQVFDRFPRLVRDFAQASGKEINLEIVGEDTELDRSLVNQIGDPLVHLVRNSIDHGIETTEKRKALGKPAQATLRLSAFHEGGHVIVQVYDDGQGLELDRIKQTAIEKGLLPANFANDLTMEQAVELIFRPGFSTNEAVTDVSGRGVGMDAVKNIVEGLSGQVEVESETGQGTCVTIKLPLTLAIIKALLVTCGGQVYALPIQSVRENLLAVESQIKTISQQKVIVLRDEILPLIDLNEALGFGQLDYGDTLSVIVVESQGEKAGFVVDDIIGQQEIVIKSLSDILGDIRGISGATVLGNGEVALILDHNSLIKGRSESIGQDSINYR
ncbi:MAG: chemotaxis protein CheA [Firmicutes bacterium]|nr:chemotaxis protein CheA [Bacillota bacterium]